MPLFQTRRQWAIFLFVCAFVFIFNTLLKYREYQNFINLGEQAINARVVQDYFKVAKNGRKMRILRLNTPKFDFYTTARKDELIKTNDTLNLVVFNINVSFFNYLSGLFYMPSSERKNLNLAQISAPITPANLSETKQNDDLDEIIAYDNFSDEIALIRLSLSSNLDENLTQNLDENLNSQNTDKPLKIDENPLRQKVLEAITAQHTEPKMKQFYAALFLAQPIDSSLRDDVIHWGIAHLIAISGYHLGVIMGVFFLVLAPIYRYFSARYFPYRDYKFDISFLAICAICAYFYILGLVPSFFRAFVMSLCGFLLLMRGIRLVNFGVLLVAVCLCVALIPSLLFSVGFYFSCAGVFYIFLYLKYLKAKFGLFMHSILLNFYLFFTMQIPVLYFFPLISFQQFGEIPLTYAFSIFYPLSFLLHLFGFGGVMDEWLLKFLELRIMSFSADIGLFLFVFYNLISLLAIKLKPLFFILPIFGALCFIVFFPF